MARIQCPHCGKGYQLPDEKQAQYAGKKINCKACQKPFVVPALEAAAPPEPDIMDLAGEEAPAYTPPPMPAAAPRSAPPTRAAPAMPGMSRPQRYEAPERNPMATASLVLGLVGWIIPVLPALLALIFGILALIKTRRPNVSGRGLALAALGITIGGVVLHVSLVLAAIPKVKAAIEVANRVACSVHLAAIESALDAYTTANNGAYPDTLQKLQGNGQNAVPASMMTCPSAAKNNPGQGGYIYVAKGRVKKPTTQPTAGAHDVVLVYEAMGNHGPDGINVLWEGGSLTWLPADQSKHLIEELQKGHNPPTPPAGGWKMDLGGD